MFAERLFHMMNDFSVLILDVFEICVGVFVYATQLLDHISDTSSDIPTLEQVNANPLLARKCWISLLGVERRQRSGRYLVDLGSRPSGLSALGAWHTRSISVENVVAVGTLPDTHAASSSPRHAPQLGQAELCLGQTCRAFDRLADGRWKHTGVQDAVRC